MIDRVTHTLAAWSVRSYPLILQVYPAGFRREFGDSMTQVFQDLARDACKASGLVGLAVLWMRTVVDLLVSVVDAYSREKKEPMFRATLVASLLYVCALALATAYGATRFGEFYEAPAFNLSGAPTASEDVLIAAYDRALAGEFGRYRRFTSGAGLLLAGWLGVASALFGLWQRSMPHGAGAFAAGTVLTVAAFEWLPSIWFPLDNYAVGFLWLLRGVPVAAAVWVVVTGIGRLAPRVLHVDRS